MINDILEYIANEKNRDIQTLVLGIFINNIEESLVSQIREIAKKVKSVKIVTDNIDKLSHLEEELYIEYGIALQITNNKGKSLTNVDIVINYDFNKENLIKYEIPNTITIVNILSRVELDDLDMNFNVINDYDIDFKEEILEEFEDVDDFEKPVFYESLVFRRDTFEHIKMQLNQDKVRLLKIY